MRCTSRLKCFLNVNLCSACTPPLFLVGDLTVKECFKITVRQNIQVHNISTESKYIMFSGSFCSRTLMIEMLLDVDLIYKYQNIKESSYTLLCELCDLVTLNL